MEGLYEVGFFLFLIKIFEMVEDFGFDLIVFWSKVRNSFIVWDLYKLFILLLFRFFKYGNFFSFI